MLPKANAGFCIVHGSSCKATHSAGPSTTVKFENNYLTEDHVHHLTLGWRVLKRKKKKKEVKRTNNTDSKADTVA